MAGISAFREAYMLAEMEGFEGDVANAFSQDFSSPDSRATRYDVLWAYYQGNAYRNLHKWAKKLKHDYGLYTYIRDIYNPAGRICNFHQTHIWGGHLDKVAGDGSEKPSALPITDVANESLREAIAKIWQWSRFRIYKDIVTLYGSVYGDVFLKVVDMPDRELVYIDRVHPGWIVDVRRNALDEITYYEMQYMRLDPERNNGQKATYTERATLLDNGVVYQTLRNNQPYDWDGYGEEWVIEYPFVPLVHIQHFNVGLDWGWSELFQKLSTFRELDDQASKLGDQVRKMVDSPWFFTGVRPGKDGGTITIEGLGTENEGTVSEISREETPLLYAYEPGARAFPLVAELDIEAALNHVKEISFEVERSYPELRTALWRGRGQGDVSGRALILARQEADDKVTSRRVNYDEKLVTAHRMALAIAGEAGYDGFNAYSFQDWDGDTGPSAHTIKADRPVFKPHPSESLDHSRQLWTNAALAQRVGVPLDIFLKDQQWDPERIAEITDSPLYQAHLTTLLAQAEIAEGQAGQAGEGEGDEVQNPRGDISGRGSPVGSQDFDVNTIQSREG
jgi:hypothetical protein